MARKTGSMAETTRPRIREAAARLFSKAGYDAVTMRGIGAEAGLSAGALYRYFPDKESLAAALLADAVEKRDRVLDRALGAAATSGTVEALEAFVRAYLGWRMAPGGGPALIALMSGALGSDADRALEDRVEALLAAGQEAGAVRLPDTRAGAGAVLAVLDRVAEDARLTEDRRLRIGWRFVHRLVGA